MDRFEKVISEFEDALERLGEAYEKTVELRGKEEYPFYRDSTVQRFEFTFETAWRAMKEFLGREGILCRSPRGCARELFSAGYISEEDAKAFFRMIEDRNLTVHTYREEVAEEIVSRMGEHIQLLRKFLGLFRGS